MEVINNTVPSQSSSKPNIFRFLFFILFFVLIVFVFGLYFVFQNYQKLSTQVNNIVNLSQNNQILTPTPLVVTLQYTPDEFLVKLERGLGVSAPTFDKGTDLWVDKNKEYIPLLGKQFSLTSEVSSSAGKYSKLSDIKSIEKDVYKPIQSSIDEIFKNYGFTKINEENRLINEGVEKDGYMINTSFENGNLKCLSSIFIYPSKPTIDIFCGNVDQRQFVLRNEFIPVINPTFKYHFYVAKMSDTYAVGNFFGGKWWAVKLDGQWTKIYSGPKAISCDLVKQYNIPKDISGTCKNF